MYRQKIYRCRHSQLLLQLAASGYPLQLSVISSKNPYYGLIDLSVDKIPLVVMKLMEEPKKTQLEQLYCVILMRLNGSELQKACQMIKMSYPEKHQLANLQELVSTIKIKKLIPRPIFQTSVIKTEFNRLLAQSVFDKYFELTDVPVFLVSKEWMNRFNDSDDLHLEPINNQNLVEIMDFVSVQPQYLHYNLVVKAIQKQQYSFILLSQLAWKYIHNIYDGLEVRRHTSKKIKPIPIIHLTKVKILVVEERCIFNHFLLQIYPNDDFQLTLARIVDLITSYQMVRPKYLNYSKDLYIIKDMSLQQIIKIIQNDSTQKIDDQNFFFIDNFKIQFQQISFIQGDTIVINFVSPQLEDSIFSRIQAISIIKHRSFCHHCENPTVVKTCKCKAVFFCGDQCQRQEQSHVDRCNEEVANQMRISKLIQNYRCGDCGLLKMIKPSKKMVGMINTGNLCYINAALQCILNIEQLCLFYATNQHLKDININNAVGCGGHLGCAYGQFMKQYLTTDNQKISTRLIMDVFKSFGQFIGDRQQDSQQFLIYFLDKLHEDFNRIKKKKNKQGKNKVGRSDQQASEISWKNHKKLNDSIVEDIFMGQYHSKILCPNCNSQSSTFDPFLTLTLPFPQKADNIKIEGLYLSKEGQYQKAMFSISHKMMTQKFIDKYFKQPMQIVYQKQKRIFNIWNNNQPIDYNIRDKGQLFFFRYPQGHHIQLTIQFQNSETKKRQYYSRRLFLQYIIDLEDLQTNILLSLKGHLRKALSKEFTNEQLINYCRNKKVLKLIKIKNVTNSQIKDLEFPIDGIQKVIAQIQLCVAKLQTLKLINFNEFLCEYKLSQSSNEVNKELTIAEMLQNFSSPQQLTNDNAWFCSACNDYKLAIRTISVYRLPLYLIIHLKRFSRDGINKIKSDNQGRKICIPIAVKALQIFSGIKYQLFGMVNHFGTLMQGHYTATVLKDNGWINFDDEALSLVDQLDGSAAYLLFFKRAQ